uniref:Uncharacterized protein n=1 Tax=Plectus sambesii TaxID=2011161 RepID=A0A914WCW3_9BILA
MDGCSSGEVTSRRTADGSLEMAAEETDDKRACCSLLITLEWVFTLISARRSATGREIIDPSIQVQRVKDRARLMSSRYSARDVLGEGGDGDQRGGVTRMTSAFLRRITGVPRVVADWVMMRGACARLSGKRGCCSTTSLGAESILYPTDRSRCGAVGRRGEREREREREKGREEERGTPDALAGLFAVTACSAAGSVLGCVVVYAGCFRCCSSDR